MSSGNHSNWMELLPSMLWSEPLRNIAIPGSHDSFSYFLQSDSPIDPGSPALVAKLASAFGAITRRIVKKWSVTQNLTLTEQLELGIRYFDFRVSTWEKRAELYFVHGLFGDQVVNGLNEMGSWLKEHPKEVILIDFNHFYEMTDDDHSRLIKMISETFLGKLCPPSVGIENVTLSQLWDKELQVLVFYHHSAAHVAESCVWAGYMMPSVWPNTTDAQIMKEKLQNKFTRGRPAKTFWICQGILTPTAGTVAKHPLGSLETTLAGRAAEAVKLFLKGKSSGVTGINIVIADFVEKSDFVSSVLALNPS